MPEQIKALPVSHPSSLELTEEIIRVRAYQLFEQRGYEHGHDVEDWIIAEAEVLGKKPAVLADDAPVRPTVAAAA